MVSCGDSPIERFSGSLFDPRIRCKMCCWPVLLNAIVAIETFVRLDTAIYVINYGKTQTQTQKHKPIEFGIRIQKIRKHFDTFSSSYHDSYVLNATITDDDDDDQKTMLT